MPKKAPMRPGARKPVKPVEGQRSLYSEGDEQPPPSEPVSSSEFVLPQGTIDEWRDEAIVESMTREEADAVLSQVPGDDAIVASMLEDDAPEAVRRSAAIAVMAERPNVRRDVVTGISRLLAKARTADDLRDMGQILAEITNLMPAERDMLRTCFLFVRRAIESGRQAELEKHIGRVTCKRCKAVALFDDTKIREKAVRRDCAICGFHIDFPLWDGAGAYDRPNVFEPLD